MFNYLTPPEGGLQKYCLIDLEWTVYRGQRLPVEVALIILGHEDGQWTSLGSYQSFIHFHGELTPEVQELTGITKNDLQQAPHFSEVAEMIELLSRDTLLVAHGAQNDREVLEQSYSQIGQHYQRRWLCSKELATQMWPGLKSYELSTLVELFSKTAPNFGALHRAMPDCQRLQFLFTKLFTPPQVTLDLAQKVLSELSLDQEQKEAILSCQNNPGIFSLYGGKKLLAINDCARLKDDLLTFLCSLDGKQKAQISRVELKEAPHELCNLLLAEGLKQRFSPELNKLLDKSYPWGLYAFKKDNEQLVKN